MNDSSGCPPDPVKSFLAIKYRQLQLDMSIPPAYGMPLALEEATRIPGIHVFVC
jgi:hypothetical protein